MGAFESWRDELVDEDTILTRMKNVQLLNECKDTCDSQLFSCRHQGASRSCATVVMIDEATDEDFLDHEMADPVEEIAPLCQVNPIVEYTLHKNAQQLDVSLTCLHHMESSGHLDIPPGPCVIDVTTSTNNEEVGNDCHLEDEWKHAYDKRKNKWKCDQQDSVSKAPAKMYFDAVIQPCILGNNGDPCVPTSDQHQPFVSVWPSRGYKNEPQDRNLLAQQIAEKFLH